MEEELNKTDFKIVKSIASIAAKIPNVPIMETCKENELCSRYLDPLLCGLFDEPDDGVFFRWTNEKTNDDSRDRPDAVISHLEGVKWADNQGFGEAKCATEAENNYLTSIDLIRLGMFSKRAIDHQASKGVLTIQAIGISLTFYITIHTHDNLYIMYELAEILAPRCIDDILKYLMDFNKLRCVVELFAEWCEQASPNPIAASPDLSNLWAFVSPTTNRSRDCITKHFYH
ncbi:hypothetical protein MBANPS3_002581 [Mucor bainieri]